MSLFEVIVNALGWAHGDSGWVAHAEDIYFNGIQSRPIDSLDLPPDMLSLHLILLEHLQLLLSVQPNMTQVFLQNTSNSEAKSKNPEFLVQQPIIQTGSLADTFQH